MYKPPQSKLAVHLGETRFDMTTGQTYEYTAPTTPATSNWLTNLFTGITNIVTPATEAAAAIKAAVAQSKTGQPLTTDVPGAGTGIGQPPAEPPAPTATGIQPKTLMLGGVSLLGLLILKKLLRR